MPLSPDVMFEIAPQGLPPWRPEAEWELRKAAFLREIDGGEGPFSRGYFWQKQLAATLRAFDSWMSDSLTGLGYPHELLRQAVGYVEVDAAFAGDAAIRAASRGTGHFFGAILYDHRGGAEGFGRDVLDMGEIDPACAGIPAVRLAAADVQHAPHPVGATATCWAAPTGLPGAQVVNVLTAKHAVLGIGRNQSVAMAAGGFGTLIDFCASSVDAALVAAPVAAKAPAPLPIDVDPAVGLAVSFTGAGGPKRSGRITQTWVHPADSDPYDPQRVLFDVTGVKGESGALVRLDATAEAVGIYTGVRTGRSTQMGMSQAMWQAADLLKIDLYE